MSILSDHIDDIIDTLLDEAGDPQAVFDLLRTSVDVAGSSRGLDEPAAVELIRIIFTEDDAISMVEAHNDALSPPDHACILTGADGENDDDCDTHDHEGTIDVDAALERAHEWAKHIADTATSLCSEQLEAVIRYGTP